MAVKDQRKRTDKTREARNEVDVAGLAEVYPHLKARMAKQNGKKTTGGKKK